MLAGTRELWRIHQFLPAPPAFHRGQVVRQPVSTNCDFDPNSCQITIRMVLLVGQVECGGSALGSGASRDV